MWFEPRDPPPPMARPSSIGDSDALEPLPQRDKLQHRIRNLLFPSSESLNNNPHPSIRYRPLMEESSVPSRFVQVPMMGISKLFSPIGASNRKDTELPGSGYHHHSSSQAASAARQQERMFCAGTATQSSYGTFTPSHFQSQQPALAARFDDPMIRPASGTSNYRQLKLAKETDEIGRSILKTSTQQTERAWDNVGRIGGVAVPYYSSVDSRADGTSQQKRKDEEAQSSAKKHKKRTKDKKKKGDGQMTLPAVYANSSGGQDDDSVKPLTDAVRPCQLQNLPFQSQQEQSGPAVGSKRRSKKRTRTSGQLNTNSDPPFNLTEETFAGIEHTDIWNAAHDEDSLSLFQRTIATQKSHIAWTMIFLDTRMTTPFEPSSRKYCTEKGPPCTRWNCTCDTHVRGAQAHVPVMGVMIVCGTPQHSESDSEKGFSDATAPNSVHHSCFILPLGRCNDGHGDPEPLPSNGYKRMATWPLIPFCCEVPVQRRWEVFRSLIVKQRHKFKCVTFQAAVSLMPLHFHQWFDLGRPMDLIISSIWDLKVAAWMLKPHASEEELEFETIAIGFPHLHPPSTQVDGATEVLKGMIYAKDSLILLWNMYQAVDKIISHNGLDESLECIEGPLQSVLASMEVVGIGFLPRRLSKIQMKIERRINELQAEARSIAQNHEFMLSSPQQVARLLYEVLRIQMPQTLLSTNSSHHASTSEATLQEIKACSDPPHRIIDVLLEFRSLSKLLTAFIRPLQLLARQSPCNDDQISRNDEDVRKRVMYIHPMWMQTSVRTGRLSCRKPNMQQIPNEGAFDVVPRDAFCASSEDLCLLSCDYSQNEVRILAHLSNDPVLISVFSKDEDVDIYKQMSSFVTGKPISEVSAQERSISKQVVLAILYGMGINQVAKKLHIDRNAAQRTINSFYQRFRGVKQWMEETKESARRNGYVTTMSGRRRYLDINSRDDSKRAQAERQAINTVVQGSAADLIKLAMLKMASRITDWNKEGDSSGGSDTPPKLILQIHDELLFEVSANEGDIKRLKDAVTRCCARECERDLKLKVPLKLDFSVGKSWGSAMRKL